MVLPEILGQPYTPFLWTAKDDKEDKQEVMAATRAATKNASKAYLYLSIDNVLV